MADRIRNILRDVDDQLLDAVQPPKLKMREEKKKKKTSSENFLSLTNT